MKVATIILVVLGILASVLFGIFWVTDYNDSKESISALEDMGAGDSSIIELAKDRNNCAMALFICSAVSLLTVFLMGKLKKISALIFLLSAIVPAIILPESLIFTFLFIIGGILAFFVKNKAVTEQAQVQA